MFYLALACHQLSQLVAMLGLPEYVTSYVHRKVDKDIGQLGVFGTSGGQCIFEYPGKIPFTYTGTRAAGQCIFEYGTPLDLHRDGAGNGSYMVKKEI